MLVGQIDMFSLNDELYKKNKYRSIHPPRMPNDFENEIEGYLPPPELTEEQMKKAKNVTIPSIIL